MKKEIEQYFDRLWPIPRSILGEGFRTSLNVLGEIVPFDWLRFKSGEQVLDWTIPKEWIVREAYFIDPNGKKRADFHDNNLHLLNYSVPFKGTVSLHELKEHLYTLPDMPDAIPYVTSYYKERWGFCLSDSEMQSLPEGNYTIHIDTEHVDGELVVGEAVLQGNTKEEVLFSSYLCHPSLANNELSGPLVLSFLYRLVAALPQRRYTYRFVVSAETIGTISYLSQRGQHLKQHTVAGYQLTCIGDRGNFTYKRSRMGSSLADRIALFVLNEMGTDSAVIDFDPSDGSDERQYCSPGFNLPLGSLMRTKYAEFKEYHTSLDNKDFISFEALEESVRTCFRIVQCLEFNATYRNTVMFGEPQLGKRDLYPTITGNDYLDESPRAIMWLLNLADSHHDLVAISEKSKINYDLLNDVAQRLIRKGLLVQQ